MTEAVWRACWLSKTIGPLRDGVQRDDPQRKKIAVVAVTRAAPATSSRRPKTAKDIKWPKPSQEPGTVTFKSRYPTEEAWNPLLKRFRTETGPAFDAMVKLAEESAQQLKSPRSYRTTHPTAPSAEIGGGGATAKSPAGGTKPGRDQPAAGTPVAADAPPPLLKAIDIVRIPLLTGEKLAAKLNTLRRQLSVLEIEGYDYAVWDEGIGDGLFLVAVHLYNVTDGADMDQLKVTLVHELVHAHDHCQRVPRGDCSPSEGRKQKFPNELRACYVQDRDRGL